MSKDYYSILGVERNASADEIKKAYRKKAMDSHPDRHNGDTAKETEFKAINEAYAVLSDAQKKHDTISSEVRKEEILEDSVDSISEISMSRIFSLLYSGIWDDLVVDDAKGVTREVRISSKKYISPLLRVSLG